MQQDSPGKTLLVATLLCIVCSVMVTSSAVMLRERQVKNKQLDIKKNLLLASGLLTNPKASATEIAQAYEAVQAEIIDLESGKPATHLNIDDFDQRKFAKDPMHNHQIPSEIDTAGIKVRSKYAIAYRIVKDQKTSMIVLPINGKGLWSTLYGFIALAPDTSTIKGIGFYEHGETPGLGGEVDNSGWKQQWVGKQALNERFEPAFTVTKGQVTASTPDAQYKVDGLSGATITSNGVTGFVQYWLGDDAFGPYLAQIRQSSLL